MAFSTLLLIPIIGNSETNSLVLYCKPITFVTIYCISAVIIILGLIILYMYQDIDYWIPSIPAGGKIFNPKPYPGKNGPRKGETQVLEPKLGPNLGPGIIKLPPTNFGGKTSPKK